jgi:hypothetical protein
LRFNSIAFILSAPEDLTIVKEMQRLEAKIEEMRNQRSMLEEQFRRKVQEDDITNTLVTRQDTNQEASSSSPAFFHHSKTCGYIDIVIPCATVNHDGRCRYAWSCFVSYAFIIAFYILFYP